jgi:hypothetical protein
MKFSLDGAKEFLSDKATDLSESFEENITNNLKEFGADKINDIWDGVNESSAVLLKAGYTITNIVLTLGLPPSMNVSFSNVHHEELSDIKRLMVENKENKVLYVLLGAILKAEELKGNMRTGVYEFNGLVIKLGAKLPQIDMVFKKDLTKAEELLDASAGNDE